MRIDFIKNYLKQHKVPKMRVTSALGDPKEFDFSENDFKYCFAKFNLFDRVQARNGFARVIGTMGGNSPYTFFLLYDNKKYASYEEVWGCYSDINTQEDDFIHPLLRDWFMPIAEQALNTATDYDPNLYGFLCEDALLGKDKELLKKLMQNNFFEAVLSADSALRKIMELYLLDKNNEEMQHVILSTLSYAQFKLFFSGDENKKILSSLIDQKSLALCGEILNKTLINNDFNLISAEQCKSLLQQHEKDDVFNEHLNLTHPENILGLADSPLHMAQLIAQFSINSQFKDWVRGDGKEFIDTHVLQDKESIVLVREHLAQTDDDLVTFLDLQEEENREFSLKIILRRKLELLTSHEQAKLISILKDKLPKDLLRQISLNCLKDSKANDYLRGTMSFNLDTYLGMLSDKKFSIELLCNPQNKSVLLPKERLNLIKHWCSKDESFGFHLLSNKELGFALQPTEKILILQQYHLLDEQDDKKLAALVWYKKLCKDEVFTDNILPDLLQTGESAVTILNSRLVSNTETTKSWLTDAEIKDCIAKYIHDDLFYSQLHPLFFDSTHSVASLLWSVNQDLYHKKLFAMAKNDPQLATSILEEQDNNLKKHHFDFFHHPKKQPAFIKCQLSDLENAELLFHHHQALLDILDPHHGQKLVAHIIRHILEDANREALALICETPQLIDVLPHDLKRKLHVDFKKSFMKNLLSYKGQVLTKERLVSVLEVLELFNKHLQHNFFGFFHKTVCEKPPFLLDLKQLIGAKMSQQILSEDEIAQEMQVALEVFFEEHETYNLVHAKFDDKLSQYSSQMIAALKTTSTLKKPMPVKIEVEETAEKMRNNFQIIISCFLERKNHLGSGVESILRVLNTIELLIQHTSGESDELKPYIKYHWFPEKNRECCPIHLADYRTWNEANAAFTLLIGQFIHAFLHYQHLNKFDEFFNLLNNSGYCIDAKIAMLTDHLLIIDKTNFIPNFPDLMAEYIKRGEAYLAAMGQTSSLESLTNFILAHYQRKAFTVDLIQLKKYTPEENITPYFVANEIDFDNINWYLRTLDYEAVEVVPQNAMK